MQRRIYTIPGGTLLYHGTASEDEFDELLGPAWVSDRVEVAQRFGDVPEPAKSRWRALGRVPRVLTFVATADIELLLWTSGQDIREFVGDHTGSEDDYDSIDYDMIEIANMVCDEGYDGWILPKNYDGSGADIMLCSPERHLEYVRTDPI